MKARFRVECSAGKIFGSSKLAEFDAGNNYGAWHEE
jgi:hypothetical protein